VDVNALLATQAEQIASNPITTQRPDLVHFRPPASLTADDASDLPGATGGGHSINVLPAAIAAGTVALILALTSIALVRNRKTTSGLRKSLAAAPLLGALQAGLIAVVVTGHGGAAIPGPATEPVASPTAGTMLSALRTHSVSVPVGTGSRTWGSLVSIESALTSQQDHLVTDEQTIAAVTPQLNAVATAAGFARRPGEMGVLQNALRSAIADHQAEAASYTASLQNEYNFFVSTAQSPQAATELKSVAQHTPPDVANAVVTDLNLVATQLQQEAQIAAASGTNSGLPQLLTGTGLHFRAPVGGYESQPFGPTAFALEPPITYNGVFYPHFHTGIDLAAPMDTPVQAAASGVVILATSSVDTTGHLAGYGNYVVIGHGGGFMTLYGHLDKLLVSPGETVQQGQTIGLLGSTGWSTGPHVHFEIRKNGVYTDPAPYIAGDLGR
jgi:murein DD-endopeptidase MepM/ murein hydrolase activator NlpD